MTAVLAIVGTILGLLAALTHVFIFALESVLWSRPSTWRRFGVRSAEDAEVLRPMAYNQGFYNVFLAIGAGIGLVLFAAGVGAARDAGAGIAIFALASMALAAVVLVASSPKLWRSALIQGAAPVLALVFLVLALAL